MSFDRTWPERCPLQCALDESAVSSCVLFSVEEILLRCAQVPSNQLCSTCGIINSTGASERAREREARAMLFGGEKCAYFYFTPASRRSRPARAARTGYSRCINICTLY